MRRGRWGRGPAAVVGAVVVLVLGALAGCGGSGDGESDFTDRCVGGSLLVSGLFDPVDLIGVATDPLHVAVRADPAVVPPLGDQVTVVTGELTPPGITGIVTAVGPPTGGGVPLTVSVWPRDELARTFVPGAPASTWDVETDAFPRGRRDIGVASDPSSTHALTVRADDGGDVTVRYAQ